VVQALDSGGNAVPGVTVTLTVHSLPPTGAPAVTAPNYDTTYAYAAYIKGAWTLSGCTTQGWCKTAETFCLNEDVDQTGIYSVQKDLNGNGVLDPGDVAAVSPGSVVTDSTGTANVNITYPEDHATWVQVLLTASATVSGTQTSTGAKFLLPILASYVANTQASPPGQVSPYGTATSCQNPN